MIDEAKKDEVLSWLRKALEDLRAARILAGEESRLTGLVVYHRQQAAEKACKGFLVFHDVRVAKTHNVQSLIIQAERIEPMLGRWDEAATRLTPFAFLYRYPGIDDEPDSETVLEAIGDATTIVNEVVLYLPGILPLEQGQGG